MKISEDEGIVPVHPRGINMATLPKDLEQDNYIVDLMDHVAPEWQLDFRQFVETGEAREVFLNYLNNNTAAQNAVEQAFNHQAAQFEGLAAELKKRHESHFVKN